MSHLLQTKRAHSHRKHCCLSSEIFIAFSRSFSIYSKRNKKVGGLLWGILFCFFGFWEFFSTSSFMNHEKLATESFH